MLPSTLVKLYDVDPGPDSPEIVRAIIEIPKNSVNKYEYDGELEMFRLDRALYSPMHYPGDYGFIPGTLADDGDPLDILVMVDEASFTGCLMEARPVGVLHMVDGQENDQKVLAVPNRNPRFDSIHTVDQVYPHIIREIEYFFTIYKELQSAKAKMDGWGGPREARRVINESRQMYLEKRNGVIRPVAQKAPDIPTRVSALGEQSGLQENGHSPNHEAESHDSRESKAPILE